jgi:hypothetical protein
VRIAGGLLVVNGVLAIVEKAATAGADGSGPTSGVGPIVIDFIIGFSLAAHNARLRNWAILRAALGGLIFAGIQFFQGSTVLGVIQLAVSASFLMLLIGVPGKPRIAVACSLYGLYVLLELVGLANLGKG